MSSTNLARMVPLGLMCHRDTKEQETAVTSWKEKDVTTPSWTHSQTRSSAYGGGRSMSCEWMGQNNDPMIAPPPTSIQNIPKITLARTADIFSVQSWAAWIRQGLMTWTGCATGTQKNMIEEYDTAITSREQEMSTPSQTHSLMHSSTPDGGGSMSCKWMGWNNDPIDCPIANFDPMHSENYTCNNGKHICCTVSRLDSVRMD